jgi:hypothetical protein
LPSIVSAGTRRFASMCGRSTDHEDAHSLLLRLTAPAAALLLLQPLAKKIRKHRNVDSSECFPTIYMASGPSMCSGVAVG